MCKRVLESLLASYSTSLDKKFPTEWIRRVGKNVTEGFIQNIFEWKEEEREESERIWVLDD